MDSLARVVFASLAPCLVPSLALASAQERPPEKSSERTDATDRLARVEALLEAKDFAGALAAAREAVEADPDSFEAHDLYLKARNQGRRPPPERLAELTQEVEAQYRTWAERFPSSSGVAYGIGSFFYAQEDPRAKPHLARVVELDPKRAKVWQMLSIDAERWGDQAGAHEYMHRATLADPRSPDYAFYYANGFRGADEARWVEASLDVARRFPGTERGAQALYWLGVRSQDDARKIAFWEQSRREFAPDKFSWSASSMVELFEVYLRTEPQKAIALAEAMPEPKGRARGETWADRKALAERLVAVQKLVAAGKHAEAKPLAEGLEADRFSDYAAMFALLKAEVLAGAGDVQAAYDAMAARMAATPEDTTLAALLGYAKRLGKSEAQARADVWAIRDQAARPAPDFELERYGSDRKAALRDYRGKVVLLTFWFPGCGPCRGEFPHFENVLRRFRDRDDVVYLGINGLTNQDGYVLPFMRGTKYSFTPLRADDKVCSKEAYNVRGYPDNFLIDRAGRIVYQDFRTDGGSELALQRMIESLLERPATAIPAAAPAAVPADAPRGDAGATSRPGSGR